MTEKITASHLQRPAVVYVRQSTPHQVCNNEESRRLQYAMKDRLHELGWSQIEIIDDDLGRTASGITHRPRVPAHGHASQLGRDWSCRSPRGFPFCEKQPRVVSAAGDLRNRQHAADRS